MERGRSEFEKHICQIPAVPGLKFHPSNEVVISFYLLNKIAQNLLPIDPIRTDHFQDIISHHPGTLQAYYPLLPPEDAWWFYTKRDSKYPNNSKLKIERAGGYWKVSKASDPIGDIGFKRVLNFREGALKPSSTPTDWYMEEYSIKQFTPNKEDENWIIVRICQLTMTMPPTNIVPTTMPLSTTAIHTTFPPMMSMSNPYAWPNSDAFRSADNSLPLDSGEGDFSGSAFPFQPPGSGGTGNQDTEEQNPLQDDQYQGEDLLAEESKDLGQWLSFN